MGSVHASRGQGSPLQPPAQATSSDTSADSAHRKVAELDAALALLPSPCLLVRSIVREDQQEIAYDVVFSGGMGAFAGPLVGGEDALVELGIGAVEKEGVLTRELSARGCTFATIRAIARALPEGQGWLIEFVDDTVLVAQAREVRLRGQILERLVETVPLAIAAKDPSDGYRFTLVNRCFEETFGIRRADLIGASDRDFFPPELCQKYQEADEAATKDETVMVLEEEIDTAIGRRQARTIKLPLFDDQGRPELLLLIIQDVTDLRTAIRQAEQGRHVKARILQGLGREMKSRLSGVLDHMDAAGASVDAAWVRGEAAGLLSRIDEALEVSNLQVRGRNDGSQFALPLELVQRTLELSSKESESRAVTWEIVSTLHQNGADDVRLDVNPKRLTQALGHLISNAVQFSPRGAGARVRLSLSEAGDRIYIAVEDDGIGIPEEEQQALFGAFFDCGTPVPLVDGAQAGCVVREAQGLGLTLCRQLVSSMGGTISVASKIGEGSVFTMELPLVQNSSAQALRRPASQGGPLSQGQISSDRPARSERPEPEAPEAGLAPANVLLVEDNHLCQRIATRHLEAQGHRVTVVGDAARAKMAFESHAQFDFVLVDQWLESDRGVELIQYLRGLEGPSPERPRLPVLALFPGDPSIDAVEAERAQRESVDAGADTCLSKPLRPEQLSEVFARLDRR